MKADSRQNPLLAIRADGHAAIGMGHIMRTLAIAQAWRERGGNVCYLTASALSTGTKNRFAQEGIGVESITARPGSSEDAAQTLAVLEKLEASWLLADGYQFKQDFQKEMSGKYPFAYIDDIADQNFYDVDLLINPNAYADANRYASVSKKSRFLLGADYTPLRREFWKYRFRDRSHLKSGLPRVLVTLGGGDIEDATLVILKALELLPPASLEAKVIIGAENPHKHVIAEQIQGSKQSLTLLNSVASMVPWIDWADIAVTAGGSTCWEMVYAGVPCLSVVLADNQREIVHFLEARQCLISLGRYSQLTPEKAFLALEPLLRGDETRRAMGEKARGLIDGKGAFRIADFMLQDARLPGAPL